MPSSAHTESCERLRPTAIPRTSPAALLRTSVVAGRPPVADSSSPSSTRPASASAVRRALTAVRESPVARPRAPRVAACPERISASTSPAVAAGRTGGGGGEVCVMVRRLCTSKYVLKRRKFRCIGTEASVR